MSRSKIIVTSVQIIELQLFRCSQRFWFLVAVMPVQKEEPHNISLVTNQKRKIDSASAQFREVLEFTKLDMTISAEDKVCSLKLRSVFLSKN